MALPTVLQVVDDMVHHESFNPERASVALPTKSSSLERVAEEKFQSRTGFSGSPNYSADVSSVDAVAFQSRTGFSGSPNMAISLYRLIQSSFNPERASVALPTTQSIAVKPG